MIEVEIKVNVTEAQKMELVRGANFIAETSFVDQYYDSPDFKLTTNGYWLRRRDNKFELKVPATYLGTFSIHKNVPMQEIYDEKTIAQILGLDSSNSLRTELEIAGYNPLYTFANTRKSYSKGPLKIDFDCAYFADLTYEVCEVETSVDVEEQADAAFEQLYAFVKEYGISTDMAEGKLFYYIKRRNPAHYYALTHSKKSVA